MSILDTRLGVRFVEVLSPYEGQRIDNFLLRILKGVPKSKIYRILRRGEVRVNRARIRPDYRLRTGDQVRIPPLRREPEKTNVYFPPKLLERLEKAILWEDQDLLVLNKPAGLAVHKGSGLDFGVIEVMRALRSEALFLELAHRLDREASGCLVLAKAPMVLRMIQAALRSGTLEKRYLVLMRGHWNHGVFHVSAPLRKNILHGGERKVEVDEILGKPARTCFAPISLFRQASLLEVTIATGRTHQIRVHAAHIDHPIAGDDKYGDPLFNREMIQRGLRRLFLHAHSVHIPLGGREVAISAPLEEELKGVLEHLEIES